MSAKKKIKFTRSPIVYRLAYFPGDVVEMNVQQADLLIEDGFAVEYVPVISQVNDLPGDMPYRDKLIAAGVTSMEELRIYDDVTDIKGIGKKAAEAIIQYLKK